MKRDMNLVRKILQWAEQQEHGFTGGNPKFDNISEEVIDHHIYLMNDAGLIDAVDSTNLSSTSPTALMSNISWRGHEFLDASRDETIWNKAKDTILKPAAGVAFDVLLEWLKIETKKKLGLP